MFHSPDVAEALVGFDVAPWPSTEPALHSRPSPRKTRRRRIASKNLALISGQPGVPLNNVNHEYALRLSQIQVALDNLRAHTQPYDLPWGPPEAL